MITKFNLSGLDKFIRNESFIGECRQFVLSRPTSPLVKLRKLNISVEGQALKIFQSYNPSDQLTAAFDALESTLNKAELVHKAKEI